MKKKLYAGIAATAIAATGLVCSAGAAHATTSPWPSDLGYAPGGSDGVVSTAAASDGTVYTASVNADDDGVNVSTTTPEGVSHSHAIALTPSTGLSIDDVYSVAVTSTGTVVVSANQANADSSDSSDNLWTASVTDDTATLAYSAVDGNGSVISASPNGSYVALSDWNGSVTVVDLATDGSTPSHLIDSDQIDGIAVGNDGTAYVIGDDTGSLNTLWTVSAGAATRQPLASGPVSVAVAGSKVVVGEETADGDNDSLEVFDGSSTPTSVPLPNEPYYLAVSADGNTVFGSAGYDIERVDLTKLDSYTDASQVPDAYVDDIVGLVPTPDAFYAVTSAENYDTYTYGEASLSRFTKPGAVTNATQAVYDDGSIDVEWTAPADNGGSDLTYLVTLTDNATSDVITDQVTDTYDYLTSDNGLQAGHTYDITVRAENAAFSSDAATVPPVVSGSAKVTISGNPVVGGTLTATVSNSTFPDGTELSYQWGYSGGNYGGAIEGATSTTYSPTKDMIGMHIVVIVTASLDGFSPAQASSTQDVVVTAAPGQQVQPTPQPAQVTKIKPATIKANAKKVKLALPGITVAKAPGKVKVYDGKKLIGTAKIVNGKLVLKLKKHLSHGKHKLKLTYKGSAKVAKFNKKVKLKVK
jgi:hypothetical protein